MKYLSLISLVGLMMLNSSLVMAGGSYEIRIPASVKTDNGPKAPQDWDISGVLPDARSYYSYSVELSSFLSTTEVGYDFSEAAFSLSGALPSGLSFNPETGVINGSPIEQGSYPLSLTVNLYNDQRTKDLLLDVDPSAPPSWSISGVVPGSTYKSSYSLDFENFLQTSTAGYDFSPTTFSIVGDLPDGLSLNGSTGLLSGNTAGIGSYNFTLQATLYGETKTRNFSLSVAAPNIGDNIEGGYVFYVNTADKYFNVTPYGRQGSSYKWATSTASVSGASGNTFDSGPDNTRAILQARPERPIAASICDNYTGGGYSDWHLPTPMELYRIAQHVSNGALNVYVTDQYYWTSRQHSTAAHAANSYNLTTRQGLGYGKTTSLPIRCTRLVRF